MDMDSESRCLAKGKERKKEESDEGAFFLLSSDSKIANISREAFKRLIVTLSQPVRWFFLEEVWDIYFEKLSVAYLNTNDNKL